MTTRVVIVGASLGGYRSAEALRRGGFEGTITLVGDEPHLPYDRPPLSKQVLSGEWDIRRADLCDQEKLAQLNLDLRLGTRATALDSKAMTITMTDGSDGETELDFQAAILATGASARRIPEVPDGVHVLRSRDDAAEVRAAFEAHPDHLVVIGAGFIGLEVAATARQVGIEVTVIEAADLPLQRLFPPVVGEFCASLHRDAGVDLRCGLGVEGFDGDERVTAVGLTDGSTLDTDLVVVGIGVSPNTEWLAGSGLDIGEGLDIGDGIVCDEYLMASPGIFAVGDVARWPNGAFGESMRVEHWENAADQARVAAGNLLRYLNAADAAIERNRAEAQHADMEPYESVPWVWSDQYEQKLAMAGRIRPEDQVALATGSPEDGKFAWIFGRDDRLMGVFGFNRPRHVMVYRQHIAEGLSWTEALKTVEG